MCTAQRCIAAARATGSSWPQNAVTGTGSTSTCRGRQRSATSRSARRSGSIRSHSSSSSSSAAGSPPMRCSAVRKDSDPRRCRSRVRLRSGVRGPGWAETPSQTGRGRPMARSSTQSANPTTAPMLWPNRAYGRSASGASSVTRWRTSRSMARAGATSAACPRPGASTRHASQPTGSSRAQRRNGTCEPPAWCRTTSRSSGSGSGRGRTTVMGPARRSRSCASAPCRRRSAPPDPHARPGRPASRRRVP